MSLNDVDVVVLAGGLGTRLRSVLDEEGLPKVLAPVAGRPFLAFLLDWLEGFGARRVVLCLGHRAERVTAWLSEQPPRRCEVVTVIEPRPLGTAGAVFFSRPRLQGDPVLIMNGDTFVDADLGAMLAVHRQGKTGATMLCTRVDDPGRYGRVDVDERGLVSAFVEKSPEATGPGLINAGLYLFDRALLDQLAAAAGPSLERDVLPALVPGRLQTHVYEGAFIDIGTPESFALAPRVIS